MLPRVSFVVTCYNFAPYIGECLDSILAQSVMRDADPDEYEIVVIDDASTDDSAAIIRSFRDPRIRFVQHTSNRGSVASRTEGFQLARGTYVTETCGDDRYRPHFLERVLPFMDTHPTVALVYGDAGLVNGRSEIVEEPWLGIRSRAAHGGRDFRGDEFLPLLLENVIPICTVLLRREALVRIFPLRQDLAFLDWYVHLRIARENEIAYLAETLADYRIHGKNMHLQLARETAYVQTVLHILDEMFSAGERQAETRKIRGHAYALAYRRFGDTAFGAGWMTQARHYYLDALRYEPQVVFQPALLRHLAGTILGQARYDALKARYHRLSSSFSNSA